MARLSWLILLFRSVAPCFLAFSTSTWAQGDTKLSTTEQTSALISKLPSYISKWPANTSSTIVIGVLGSPDVTRLVGRLTEGLNVGGRAVAVRNVSSAADAARSQILFVARGRQQAFAQMQGSASFAHILTVGEHQSFTTQGGVLIIDTGQGEKPRLLYSKANYNRLRGGGMKVSAQLLRLAKRVK